MEKKKPKPAVGVRVDPEILHRARVRAVMQKKTLGRWLEEAIITKLESEEKSSKEVQE
jgi:predicted HicB family RNase H-like nuclease